MRLDQGTRARPGVLRQPQNGTPFRPRNSADFKLFLVDLRLANCQPWTIATYERRVGRFLDQTGKLRPAQIDKSDVANYIFSLQERSCSLAYQRSVFVALAVFFKYMVREKIMAQSPMEGLKAPRVPRHGKEFVTEEQFRRMLAVCPRDFCGARNQAWLWMLWSTGCRLDGLAKLRLKDLDWNKGRVTVIEKFNKQRVVPFSLEAQRAVYRYIQARKQHFERFRQDDTLEQLWVGEERRPLSYWGIQQINRRLMDRAGVHFKDQHHAFRRTWAMRNLSAGVPLKYVQLVGGWDDIASMEVYVRAMESEAALSCGKFC